MQRPNRLEWVMLAIIAAIMIYFFGWHEFDLFNAGRHVLK